MVKSFLVTPHRFFLGTVAANHERSEGVHGTMGLVISWRYATRYSSQETPQGGAGVIVSLRALSDQGKMYHVPFGLEERKA